MKQNQMIQKLESGAIKKNLPAIRVGDTINVHTRIIEGEKERVQVFTGTVIARKGAGLSETISLYRIAYGARIERVFMIHSPKIAKIDIVRNGDVRKSKLYYLRERSGKTAKVKEMIGFSNDKEVQEVIAAPEVEQPKEENSSPESAT
jgi:large subunit ribosomal protein L19